MSSIGTVTIDLRSDTVTRPCESMRAEMATASVGDDVYGDDPSVSHLEQCVATLLGKQAGLYLPSGTQSNLAAVLAHCRRGDEYIIGDEYHVFCHEAVGSAVLGSVVPFPIRTQKDGSVLAEDVRAAIKPDDAHYPVSRLLCLENTVSGKALTVEQLAAPAEVARAANMRVHLDGARFFNATTALGIKPTRLASVADTVSVCLSKGLGAPVGSVLVGDEPTITQARRIRKMLGGGMRQAGIVAAAGIYAVESNLDRLEQDHQRAARLAQALNDMTGLWQSTVQSHTNMVFAEPIDELAPHLFDHLARRDVVVSRRLPRMRLVLHKDIDDEQLQRTIGAFATFSKLQ